MGTRKTCQRHSSFHFRSHKITKTTSKHLNMNVYDLIVFHNMMKPATNTESVTTRHSEYSREYHNIFSVAQLVLFSFSESQKFKKPPRNNTYSYLLCTIVSYLALFPCSRWLVYTGP